MWGWQTPGDVFIQNQSKNLVSENLNIFKNFVLLKLNIHHVDQLLLKKDI